MAEYLSKEEIRQWRSSLEKITLEEFAARLGKVINEEKETSDMVDKVLRNNSVIDNDNYKIKTEKISNIAQKAIMREKEIVSIKNEKPDTKLTKKIKSALNMDKTPKVKKQETIEVKVETVNNNSDIKVTFKKPLTDREQLVFNHFLSNKNTIVYAKDLATLLDLPKDYVYKYIKNLRNKIGEDALENADKGGYVLKV